MKDIAKIFGGILIFAGTCIGAGMLSLPLQTAAGGFVGTAVLFTIFWVVMMIAGLLIAEVNLWMDEDANIISMTEATLGNFGKVIAWVCYLLIMFAANTAYIDAGSSILQEALSYFKIHLSLFWCAVSISLVTGFIVYLGTRCVDEINRWLMVGLIGSYVALIVVNISYVEPSLLMHGRPKYLFASLPIIMASFTAHMVLPSLRKYLDSNVSAIKAVVIGGCTLPFILYLLWDLIILGIIPYTGDTGIQMINQTPNPLVILDFALMRITESNWVGTLFAAFSSFALVTSFLGITLSLADFLRDGLHLVENRRNHLWCVILAILPPLIIKLTVSQLFNRALNYAGALIAVMLVILPVLMCYNGRYRQNIARGYQVFGGKPLLLLVFFMGLIVIAAQLGVELNFIHLQNS